jgi:CheY-like chemotaxis protein
MKPLNLLIIDDDADDREMFCEAVKEINDQIKCLCASGGSEALELFEKGQLSLPDLIFLDLNMPCVNGKQFLKLIKKKEDLQHIPVAIYTTSKLQEDVIETKRLGAVGFITKPTRLNDLKKEIARILAVQNSLQLPG